MELTTIELALYSLIQRFVQRQSIVLEAMRDLRPDLVLRIENRNNEEFWAKYTPESWHAFVLDYARRPATGEWGKNHEWEYFLHGIGCRLTHKVTHERIEWDLRSLRRFDRFWFVNYLKWLLDQSAEDEALSTIRDWYESESMLKRQYQPSYGPLYDVIFSLLEQLRQKNFLSGSEQYYVLISKDQLPESFDQE